MKLLYATLLSLAITGCACTAQPKVDVGELSTCSKIPVLPAEADLGQIIDGYISLIELYGICSNKQHNSIAIIKAIQGENQ